MTHLLLDYGLIALQSPTPNDGNKCSFFYNVSIIKCKINLQRITWSDIIMRFKFRKNIILTHELASCKEHQLMNIKKIYLETNEQILLGICSSFLLLKRIWFFISLCTCQPVHSKDVWDAFASSPSLFLWAIYQNKSTRHLFWEHSNKDTSRAI